MPASGRDSGVGLELEIPDGGTVPPEYVKYVPSSSSVEAPSVDQAVASAAVLVDGTSWAPQPQPVAAAAGAAAAPDWPGEAIQVASVRDADVPGPQLTTPPAGADAWTSTAAILIPTESLITVRATLPDEYYESVPERRMLASSDDDGLWASWSVADSSVSDWLLAWDFGGDWLVG